MKFSKEEIREAMLLYAISDRTWLKAGEKLSSVIEEVLCGGATFLQIREKALEAEAFEEEARNLKEICARYKVPFVVNDSVEIALKCDADGVHVGQSDIKGRDIRAMIGPDKILGMTARTAEQALAAQEAGADYIGVGAVFGSTTKKDARPMTRQTLQEIRNAVAIPVVAIGGIGSHNVMELQGSGVDGIAVISAIFAAEDPQKAAAQLLELAREMVGRH